MQQPSFLKNPTDFLPRRRRTLLRQRRPHHSFGARRRLCHRSFVVHVLQIAEPHFLLRDPLSLVLQPTVSACHEVVIFLFCAENIENPAASPSCMRQDIPKTNFSISTFISSLSSREFSIAAITSLSQVHQTLCCASRRNLLWRGRHHPSSGLRGAFSGDPLRYSSLLDSLHKQTSALWRKKRTAVQQLPQSDTEATPSHISATAEEGEAHH